LVTRDQTLEETNLTLICFWRSPLERISVVSPELPQNCPQNCPELQEREKKADLLGKGGVWPESNGEKNSLSWGRGKGEGPSLRSMFWLKSEELILVLPTDSSEGPD